MNKSKSQNMGKKLTVEEQKCKRCSHRWWPKIIDGKVTIPETCPNPKCRSPYWQYERKDRK